MAIAVHHPPPTIEIALKERSALVVVVGRVASPSAVVLTSPDNGFNWGDALVGAGVALAIAAGSIGVVYVARHHRRTGLAT